MGKVCNLCGSENSDSAVKCENCGAVLETNGVSSNNSPKPDLVLTEAKSAGSIKIPYDLITKQDESTLIIGREGDVEPEFFAEYRHISRKHCKVIFENGEYYAEHISTATNPTAINNKTLSPGIKKIIRDGDLLTLADKRFKVSICKNSIDAEQEIIPAEEIRYIITCPRCGTEYEVPDINAQKDKCEKCDKYNDYYIADEKAKVKNAG